MKMQFLKANLLLFLDDLYESGPKPFVIFSNLKVPALFSKAKISEKLLGDFSTPLKELISAARYL